MTLHSESSELLDAADGWAFRLRVSREQAFDILIAADDHSKFRSSLRGGKWKVAPDGRVKPQSIVWLFRWAANADPKRQEKARLTREAFDRILPFTFTDLQSVLSRDQAGLLQGRKDDVEVQALLEELLKELREHPTDISRRKLSELHRSSTRKNILMSLVSKMSAAALFAKLPNVEGAINSELNYSLPIVADA